MASLRDLLKPGEVAKKLGISQDTIEKWMEQGMPYIKKGKFVFIPQGDLVRWMRLDLKNEVKDQKGEPDQPKETVPSSLSGDENARS